MFRTFLALCCLALCSCSRPVKVEAKNSPSESPGQLRAVGELLQAARARVESKSWAALELRESGIIRDADRLEAPNGGRVLNSVRAMARVPRLGKPLAHLYRSVVVEGTVPRSTKLAMGMRVAQITNS